MNEQIKKDIKIIRPKSEYAANSNILRVAAYCRVSTDSEDQASSFINQISYYTDFIRSSDKMELVDIYADEGITGTSINKRDEFKRMMRDCELGKIDRIYVKSIQRFARNSLECLEAVRKLKSYGVSVYFENDRINTSNMNSEMFLYIKSAFAQNEATSHSKRMAASYRMKMESGSFITCSAPYGYSLIENELEIEPYEADIVKRIFGMYLSGKGFNMIASILNKEGIQTKGKRWTNATVIYVLTNEKYIGDSMLQKTFTTNTLPFSKKINRGERDRYYIQNSHPAIIDRETFNTVQKRIAERKNNKIQSREKQHIFSGMIECSGCGWHYKRKIQNGVVYWVCSQSGYAGFMCDGSNLRENDIKTAFVIAYNRIRENEHDIIDITISQLCKVREKIISNNSDIGQIDAEIARLCEQNAMYVKFKNQEIMDEVSFREYSTETQDRLTTLRSRRMKLLSSDTEYNCIDELNNVKNNLEELPKTILAFDDKVFEAIIKKIIVKNDHSIDFVLKGGIRLNIKMSEVITK